MNRNFINLRELDEDEKTRYSQFERLNRIVNSTRFGYEQIYEAYLCALGNEVSSDSLETICIEMKNLMNFQRVAANRILDYAKIKFLPPEQQPMVQMPGFMGFSCVTVLDPKDFL